MERKLWSKCVTLNSYIRKRRRNQHTTVKKNTSPPRKLTQINEIKNTVESVNKAISYSKKEKKKLRKHKNCEGK